MKKLIAGFITALMALLMVTSPVLATFECHTESNYDLGLMIFNLLFALLSLIYLLANVFGYGIEEADRIEKAG